MKKFGKILKIVGICLFATFSVACIFAFSYVFNLNKSINYNKNILLEANSKVEIFDEENYSLTNYNEQEGKVKLSNLPHYVPESFVSIEDKNFYNHSGINYKRVGKALINNIKSGRAKEGASTISQQLVKNTFLTNEKTIDRKIKEMLITKKMEKQFSKEEILETYLNVIYFGNNSYGIEQASKNYFNKSASELSLQESATLAGMIKSPKLYSPIFNKDNCLKRRNLVLKEMLKDGKITTEEYENAIKSDIVLSTNINQMSKKIYEQASLQEASKILNISEKEMACKGVKIFTYLNNYDQSCLKNAINNDEFYHKNRYGNIADSCGIIIDNQTNGVTAFYGKSVYDLVNMKRSPGSTIKPSLVYAPALEKGIISPSTPLLDEQTNFSGYTPKNVGNKYYGWISTRSSLEKSLNIPAIKIMQYTGLENCKNYASKVGVTFDKNDNNYAIALGGFTNGLTVKQLANTFAVFGDNGKYSPACFVRKICDKNGVLLYERNPSKVQVFSEETAYLLTDMLKSSTKTGTSSRLKNLTFDIAGKTGTVGIKNTNLNSDVWSVAYTNNRTCGVWLGNSTNGEEFNLEGCNNGGTYATSIVNDVFENLSKTYNFTQFKKPENVVELYIDSLELENNHTVKLADENCPEIFKEKAIFNKKYAPTDVGNSFNELQVVDLVVKPNKENVEITFNALPNCEYCLFRIEEDKRIMLKNFKNKRGKVIFNDENIDYDTQYEYYVEASIKNYANNSFNKVIKSKSVKIFTPSILKSNENIINKNYALI